MNHKEIQAIAAVVRDAQYALQDHPAHPTVQQLGMAEWMRCYIARDMARELRGIMRGFVSEEWFDLCDVPADSRVP